MDRHRLSTEAARLPAGRRRALPALAFAALALAPLAGCGESSSSPSASTQAASATATARSTAATATGAGTSTTAPQAEGKTGTSTTQGTPQSSTSGSGAPSTTPTAGAQPKPAAPNGSAASAPGSKSLLGTLAKKRAARRKGLNGLLGGFGTISLSSSAFKPGAGLPASYAACSSSSTSPPMQWQGVPHGATQLLLLANDLGGGLKGGYIWAVAMPASVSELPAGSLPAGAVAGTTSSGKVGWSGVCASSGTPQHITFVLYALRHPLTLSSGFSAVKARAGIKGNTLGTGLTLASAEG
jgi:phosphatidylethanolamine-binding protein (PEBP) family uncharacterized protein